MIENSIYTEFLTAPVFARFAEQLPISYTTFTAKKSFYQDGKQLEDAFEHQIKSFIEDKL